jgi:mannose-1-phosphate guanylyltransferase
MGTSFGVIMAGGSGTRFWPLSRTSRPKQLLALGSGQSSLLQQTVRRLQRFIPTERILIVTGDHLAKATAADVPDVPRENILAEPVGRNTAACIGWASMVAGARAADATLAVVPADHHIVGEDAFARDAQQALDAAASADIVTIGIKPTRPETGYGYVELGEDLGAGVGRRIPPCGDAPLEQRHVFLSSTGHARRDSPTSPRARRRAR